MYNYIVLEFSGLRMKYLPLIIVCSTRFGMFAFALHAINDAYHSQLHCASHRQSNLMQAKVTEIDL